MTTPPTNKGKEFPREPLTADEVRELFQAIPPNSSIGRRNRAILAVMYGAGLRISEVLALRPSNINIDGGSIRVLRGKGGKSRTAAINDAALVHVVRWVDRRKELRLPGSGSLMCTLAGGPVSPRYVRDMLNRAKAKTGVEKRVHPHGLRHTHASDLESNGVKVTEIQAQLGHSSLNTTAVYLGDISPTTRIENIRKRATEL